MAILAIGCSLQTVSAQDFSGVVSFGDSLSDLGNTFNDVGDYLSYFIIGYNSYYYDQGRWSDGPVWVEDLVQMLGLQALQRNDGYGGNLYGTDFAWGGSTGESGYTFVPAPFNFLSNLGTQINSYIALLSIPDARMPKVSDTLFTVWSGGNDVIYLVQEYPFYCPVPAQTIADNVGLAIQNLYAVGGRYFLVPNLPPLGDKPNYRTNPAYQKEANDFVSQYNPLLKAKVAQLKQQLPGVTIIWLDIHKLFKAVIKHPTDYKLVNVTDPAFTPDDSAHGGSVVSNPDQYLFWDTTHPTRVGHRIVANAAYKVVMSAVAPSLGEIHRPPLSVAKD